MVAWGVSGAGARRLSMTYENRMYAVSAFFGAFGSLRFFSTAGLAVLLAVRMGREGEVR